MKVLIVDDEKHVRDAINLLAQWEEHGITEVLQAADGEAAITMIEAHKPQIVLTDMRMPHKDGTELLTWLHTYAPQIKVVVISGYDDFNLVRHTLISGGMDYILKPVQAAALNAALAQAAACWKQEEQARERVTRQRMEMNEMKPHYADKLLTDLISGEGRRDALLAQLREEIKLPLPKTTCSIAVLDVSHLDHKLRAKFQNQLQLLLFTLINICNEILQSRGVAFRQLNRTGEIVILYNDEQRTLPSLLQAINEGLYSTLRRRFHFGMSDMRSFPEEAPRAYQEATSALWRRNLLEPKLLHAMQQPDNVLASRPLRLTAMQEELRLAALSGSSEQMETVTEAWMDDIQGLSSITPEQLFQWDKEWDWMQMQWLEGEGDAPPAEEKSKLTEAEPAPPLPLNDEGFLSLALLKQQFRDRLTAVSKIMTQQHTKDNFFIHDIAKYLERHYQQEISLQDIAAKFFLSREYIARKFKQEYGVTLLDYLSRFRIDKAKQLLHNPHLRIVQVAEMVGYQDEKYFSKVFKKLEGMTPGEFRKEHTLG
ncbi:response regulator [Paenibacillus guangzhouensis]|uniref:response regulator n=1 Tax=Paenibacillus guangzhouensis TaxID=1473112 RepID=UPI00126720FA|nr:response regulator [Paenibacillus guangzhouensis]